VIADPVSRQGELGFWSHPGFSGRGLATRAVAGVLGVAFEHMRLHKVTAAAFVENERAWGLLERVGMRREAHLIHDGWCKGRRVDVYVYGMLEDEWRRSYPELARAMSPGT
jgi:aminoglycoside 6'-N-acetyltransferase